MFCSPLGVPIGFVTEEVGAERKRKVDLLN